MMKLVSMSVIATAMASEVTPVEKVIQMLEGMQSKVVSEGKAEAKTYDEFACFCRDTSSDKNKSIQELEDLIADETAHYDKRSSDRDTADSKIASINDELQSLAEEKASTERKGRERREKYGFEITDMTQAVEALEGAIDVLKASDKSDAGKAFMQVKATVQEATMIAQALNLRGANKASRVLMQIPEVPVSDYDFHSNNIIDTLKELLVEFRKTKENVDAAEVSAVQEETKILQGLHDSTEAAKAELEATKDAKASANEDASKAANAVSIATASLNDDQNYLIDLTDKCNKKKQLWDQRSLMRSDELAALTGAIQVLRSKVSDHTTDQTVRLMQQSPAEFVQVKATHNPLRMLSVKSKLMRNKSRNFMASRSPREQLLNLLNSKSQTLKSAVLASVAAHVKADPLAKVKKLIEELVLRLQQEASDEEAHNGWCVKQTKLAEDKRDTNASKVDKMNSALAKGEANRDQLNERLDKLATEITELEAALAEATKIREQEQKENNQQIDDANAGQAAVEDATAILAQFYGTAKNKVKSQKDFEQFLQTSQGPEANDLPDAGFDEEYGASQDASVGVLGMLDVIKSDFIRTRETAESDEKQQAKDFAISPPPPTPPSLRRDLPSLSTPVSWLSKKMRSPPTPIT
jgi:hypothetical protein